MINFYLQKFSNGLQLITAPLANTKAVTVLILVKTGSRYEDKNLSGMSHFLEHMFFKGTRKRPTTFDLSSELDSFGAIYNAFTGHEYTGFYVTAQSKHFDRSLDILCDMLFNSKFDEEEIEREKGVISEEIKMYHDIPMDHVQSVHQSLLYGNTPLGRDIAGTAGTIKEFKQKNFLAYKNKHYRAKNIIVAIAGDKNKSDWKELAGDYFKALSSGQETAPAKANPRQISPRIKIERRKTDQAHLVLSFRTFARGDKRLPILATLNNILGGTMSSRLFIEIRERRGLAYYIHSELADFSDNGFLAASAGVEINKLNEAIEVAIHQLKRLGEEKIPEAELLKAKENLKGKMYIGLENSMAIASFLSQQQLLEKKIKQPEKIAKEIDAVTSLQVRNLARDLIKPEALNLAIVGPYRPEKQKELQKILNMI